MKLYRNYKIVFLFVKLRVGCAGNRFQIWGGGVDKCVLLLSFAQQK
jgi:hypothetical protein